MDSKEKNIDNSLESAMNMTQDEIEWLLNQQSEGAKESQMEEMDPDLMSLLTELESSDNESIQGISALLTKDERNEAVDDNIAALLKVQEEPGETAYDAMDLFSGEEGEKKKKGLFGKRSRKNKEDKETTKENKKKEKKEKTTKKSKKKENRSESNEQLDWESIELPDEYAGNTNQNSMDDALALLQGGNVAGENKEEPVKKETAKKVKSKKKEKIKEKRKSKTGKSGRKEEREKKVRIKEKVSIEDAIMELEEESEESPNKKKITMVFLASILILFGFLVVNHYFTGHANKRLAEEAFEEKDYLACYQLFYGQRLNDSQAAMYHRSELILKDGIFWRDYETHAKQKEWLEGLDELVQYVHKYPELARYADKWNCSDIVVNTYEQVRNILEADYETNIERTSEIANLEKDEDYTRALLKIVEEKKKRDAIYEKYPDILPEEEERLLQ